MLYLLLYPFRDVITAFNVFRYITFRTAYAIITALVISFIVGPWLIAELRRRQIGQTIREEGPRSHFSKAGTPTMGGLLILIALTLPTLLWADLTNRYIWLILFSTLGFGAIGFLDDYLKISRHSSRGLRAPYKFGAQVLVGLLVALALYFQDGGFFIATRVTIPFFKRVLPDLGWFYIPFVMLVIVGASNAVNLTDGLDGLAIGPVIIATVSYLIIAYAVGHAGFAEYLNLPFIGGAGELAVFAGSVIGASLGFLWFNAYPAQMFMGDVGALALGAALGTMAVITKHELLLVVIGGIFVIETVSVIVQVVSFQTTGKRVFRMAPIHHHFEQKGWEENKVVIRFWIVAILLALLSLSTLKLR
ncbi:MAG: phospho-N-acetylmuramoyl-pentapeptide-transferase [Candidatus Tectomicrobia bacterium]|uniref:Phospho-N-acetylmuramoyl-pentapeptide-transferase n=1 Tax=Tectimicrobiota bacterium TaxID=2528274 RepID=A0A932M181_UNCTE|nr:phospho-N-acetylmuramoyl-pentapeptide-transferase [Candidatus Tectomicrobia bacterium]